MYDQNDKLTGGGNDKSLDVRVVTSHQCLFSYSNIWTCENVNESSPTRATIKPLDGQSGVFKGSPLLVNIKQALNQTDHILIKSLIIEYFLDITVFIKTYSLCP